MNIMQYDAGRVFALYFPYWALLGKGPPCWARVPLAKLHMLLQLSEDTLLQLSIFAQRLAAAPPSPRSSSRELSL